MYLYSAISNHFLHNIHIEQSYSFINSLNKDNDDFVALTPTNKIKTRVKLDLNDYNLPFGLQQFNIYHIYSFEQNKLALYEPYTSSYNVVNMALSFIPRKKVSLVIGVNNLFNQEYVPHLSRIRDVAGGVPNPGRSFHISVKYAF